MRVLLRSSLFFACGSVFLSGVTSAGTMQLRSPSALSAGDTTLFFPTVEDSMTLSSPVSYTAGGNTLESTDRKRQFELDTVGASCFDSAFADGTNILYASGFSGPASPITIDFLNPVVQVGFNAERFREGNARFDFRAYDGKKLIGNFKAKGNDPNSLAFLGLQAMGGDVIPSLKITDNDGKEHRPWANNFRRARFSGSGAWNTRFAGNRSGWIGDLAPPAYSLNCQIQGT